MNACRIVRVDTLLDSIIDHEKPGHAERIFEAEKVTVLFILTCFLRNLSQILTF